MHIFSGMGQYFTSLGVLGLCLNSFIESFFLVPPPDFLLIVLNLKTPAYAFYYAFLCTVSSLIGGIVGFVIGRYGGRPVFDWIFSCLEKKGSSKAKKYFDTVEKLYDKYGSWAVFFAAFTPIPYKVFTITSGILKMNFLSFCLASFFGRGMRFFIVSGVLYFFGEKIKDNIELVIIATTVLIILFCVVLYKKRHKIANLK